MIDAALLDAYLEGWRGRTFDWAGANCARHFAGGWVLAAEGRDLLADLPQTPDAAAAARLLRALGGLSAAVTARLGREPIPALMAASGDLVLVVDDDRSALGICNGRLSAVVTPGGLHFRQTAQALHAWRVAP